MSLFGSPNVSKLQAKKDTAGLIKALSYHKDMSVCQAAAKALGQLGDAEAIEPLIETLEEEDSNLRGTALWSLARFGTPECVEAIHAAISEKDPIIQNAAAEALGYISDPQGIPPLLDLLKRRDETTFATTLQSLVQIGSKLDESSRNEQIVMPIGDMLKDSPSDVRETIFQALEKMGWKPDQSSVSAAYWAMKNQWERCVQIGEASTEPLIRELQDDNKERRQAIFQALVQIGLPTVPALINTLKDTNPEIRQAAYWILIKIGNPALDLLIDALKDEHDDIRRGVANILGQIGDPRVVVPLIGLFSDRDWSVRRDAYKSIVKIGKGALPQLIEALRHENGEIRWGAAGTLEAMGWKPSKDETGAIFLIVKGEWNKCSRIGPPAVKPLIETLHHWDTSVCKEAMGSLVTIGEPSVLSLIDTLQSDNPQARKCAATALGMIGDERAEQPLMSLLSEKDKEVSQAASEAISAIQTGEVWRGTS